MVKERKLQTGVSNTPTPRDGDKPSNMYASKSNFVRTWSHQLIAPDMYKPRDDGKKKDTRMKQTATWRPSEVSNRDFTTTHKSTYLDPRTVPANIHDQSHELSTVDIAASNEETRARQRSISAMCQLVKSTHGSVSSMLRSFHKKSTDSISISELHAYLQRHQLDSYLTEADLRNVFALVQENRETVPVKDFLQTIEKVEFNRSELNHEQQQIKDFLELQLQKRRSTTSELHDETKDEIKKQKAIANEAEMMRKALGMNTYSLNVGHEELNSVIENAFDYSLSTDAQRKYLRFLHHSNLKLSSIPFYDNRATELNRLKDRAVNIHQTLHDPQLAGKYEELSQTYHRGSLSTCHSADFLQTFKPANRYAGYFDEAEADTPSGGVEEERQASRRNGSSGGVKVSQSVTDLALSARPSPLASSASAPALALPKSPTTASSSPSPFAATGGGGEGEGSQPAERRKPSIAPVSGRNLISSSARGADFSSIASSSVSSRDPFPSFQSSSSRQQKAELFPLPGKDAPLPSRATPTAPGPVDVPHPSSSSPVPTPATTMAPTDARPAVRNREDYPVSVQDFLPTIYSGEESMGRMRDPAKVLRMEKVDPVVEAKHGRRLCEENVNWTCHLSQDRSSLPTDAQSTTASSSQAMTSSSSLHGGVLRHIAHKLPPSALKEEDHFLTTSKKFYSPLIYKPSQPVTRDAASDAEIQSRVKEYRRQQRYERLKANMDVTANRLQFEAMQKELQSLNRQHSRVEDHIRYKTAIFLQDLRAFRAQPLQRMAKRQNIELSDRMWGGNADRQTAGIAPDGRDFQTTYNSSFDSTILTQSMNIRSMEGIKPSLEH